MPSHSTAAWLLGQEARALLTRVDRLQPFSLQMPMVAAAAVSPAALSAIENHMIQARRSLRRLVHAFIEWLHGDEWIISSRHDKRRQFDPGDERKRRCLAVIIQCVNKSTSRRREQIVELPGRKPARKLR